MKILEEHEYKKYFESIQLHSLIAPFGFWWTYIPQQKIRVITKKEFVWCFQEPNWRPYNKFFPEIKTYENCHAKLAMGVDGALIGSWNWSLKHDKKARHHELVIFVNENAPLLSLLDWFDNTWKKAHSLESLYYPTRRRKARWKLEQDFKSEEK